MASQPDQAARFSVVMPAHNEQSVILRTLRAFVPDLLPGEAQVIVAANGCTDDTAAVARSVAGVEVIEVEVASKSAALNAGDQRATAFPRIYVDADVELSIQALRATADALRGAEPRVAAPKVRFVLDGRPAAVRAFYAVYQQLPYVDAGLTGLGVYGLSAAGRSRFDDFPSITADDLFIQRLFNVSERVVVDSTSFAVQTPRNLRSLVAVRTRTAYGNKELAATDSEAHGASTGGTLRALVDLMRRKPWMAPSVVVYAAVTVTARLRARRRAASQWQRDDSTR